MLIDYSIVSLNIFFGFLLFIIVLRITSVRYFLRNAYFCVKTRIFLLLIFQGTNVLYIGGVQNPE